VWLSIRLSESQARTLVEALASFVAVMDALGLSYWLIKRDDEDEDEDYDRWDYYTPNDLEREGLDDLADGTARREQGPEDGNQRRAAHVPQASSGPWST
jgi:hypothetical protein